MVVCRKKTGFCPFHKGLTLDDLEVVDWGIGTIVVLAFRRCRLVFEHHVSD